MRRYGSPWGRPSLQRANKGIEWKSIYHRTINNIFLPSEAMSDSENQPEKEAEVEKKVIGSALLSILRLKYIFLIFFSETTLSSYFSGHLVYH